MERIEDDGRIPYKKIGGGALRWNKQLIKPGQVIRLNPNEVPENFKDVLIPMEKIREKTDPPIEITKAEYTIEPRGKSKSLFDVVDKQGKVVNDKAQTKANAEELVRQLSQ